MAEGLNSVGGIESLNVGRKSGRKWTCGSLGGEQRSAGGWVGPPHVEFT